VAASVLSLCLFSAAGLRAQTASGAIVGRVLNQGSNEYLRSAVVTVVGTELTATAEAGGVYRLLHVPAGPQTLRFTYAGLETKEQGVVVTAGQTPTVDISLGAEDRSVVRLDSFVVTTEREGNAKMIMEQKHSIEAKRVLATDTFGSISEGNVGEFIKYLPGVVVDYTEADARSVSLGGLDPKYTSITLDGSPIASSGPAAASGTGANRAFEFEQISINSIEAVELSRTPQPENPGSAMAGGVNLRSKGAFDRKGRMVGLRAGVAFNSLSGPPWKQHPGWDDEDHYRIQPNWGVDFSDVYLDNRLGVRAGYNYSYTFSEQKAEEQTVMKFGRLTVAPGVRYERTRGRAAGPSDIGVREADRRIIGNTRPTSPIDQGGLGLTTAQINELRQRAEYLAERYGGGRQYARQDYGTWLRYLHTTYRFKENWVLKSSWNQAISRVDMNRLIGGLVVTEDNPDDPRPNRANAGNANLRPELPHTLNVTLEYYLKRLGQISIAGYRRDMKDLLRSTTCLVPAGGTWNGEPLPATVSREDWEINTVENVGMAHMSLLEFSFMREFSFLPGPLSRIRVNANYTRVRYDNYENFRRPTNIANLSWFVPYRDFRLQGNTNWRPGYRTEVDTAPNGWANWNRESLTHTMDFTWNFRRNTDSFVNARNIFNQDGRHLPPAFGPADALGADRRDLVHGRARDVLPEKFTPESNQGMSHRGHGAQPQRTRSKTACFPLCTL